MAAKPVNGSGNGARSGAQTLVLLSTPLNAPILRALGGGPMQQTELRRETGSPAQTTLRTQLKRLEHIGAIEKQRLNRFPGVLEYELTPAGHGLLAVADALDSWLERAGDGPLPLGGTAARAAVRALTEGWSTTMLRALAAGPLSLTELDRVISALSYPSLERRLAAMRLAGQVETCAGNGRGTPYALTDWARRGIGPLLTAARWERHHMPTTTASVGRVDVEAAFLLSVPLLLLSSALSGSCRMAIELNAGKERRLAGVLVTVENGRIDSCTTRLQGTPDASALGTVTAWLHALIDADTDRLEPGGDARLARALLEALHRELFGTAARST